MRKLEVVYVRPEKSGRAPLDNRSNITQKCYSFLTACEGGQVWTDYRRSQSEHADVGHQHS